MPDAEAEREAARSQLFNVGGALGHVGGRAAVDVGDGGAEGDAGRAVGEGVAEGEARAGQAGIYAEDQSVVAARHLSIRLQAMLLYLC